MIRAPIGSRQYWFGRVDKFSSTVREHVSLGETLSHEPLYEPQFQLNICSYHLRLLLLLYSSGAPIRDLPQHFPGLLDAWELSNHLSDEVCKEHGWQTCRDWDFSLSNLNHYNWCFWLVGLALALGIPDEQWQRLIDLVGSEGDDVLLDRVIASRTPTRRIGTKLLHAKPYARLLKAVDAPADQQAGLLRDFVDHWYPELKRSAPRNKKAPTIEPFWYIYGDPVLNPLEMGSYFGRWCIEAVAAVKVFGLEDSLCLGHEHYPGDLLRPDGPSTHPQREAPKAGWLTRLFGSRSGYRNTAEQHSRNSSSSSSVSIGISWNTAAGLQGPLAASQGRGHADGSDVTYSNTHVTAGQQLTLSSGSDTTLQGAVASGQRVTGCGQLLNAPVCRIRMAISPEQAPPICSIEPLARQLSAKQDLDRLQNKHRFICIFCKDAPPINNLKIEMDNP